MGAKGDPGARTIKFSVIDLYCTITIEACDLE